MRYTYALWIQLRRLVAIILAKKTNALRMVCVMPIVLGGIVGLAFQYQGERDVYDFILNRQYPYFLFMMLVTSVLFGLINTIKEIFSKMRLIEKELLFKTPPSSYIFSSFLVYSVIVTIQCFLFYSVSHWVLEIPDEFFYKNTSLMIVSGICSVAMGLFFSALVKHESQANTFLIVLIIFQIIVGGGFIQYADMSKKLYLKEPAQGMPCIAMIATISWVYEAIIVANYTTPDSFNHRNDAIEIIVKDAKKARETVEEAETTVEEIETQGYLSLNKQIAGVNISTFTWAIGLLSLFTLLFLVFSTRLIAYKWAPKKSHRSIL